MPVSTTGTAGPLPLRSRTGSQRPSPLAGRSRLVALLGLPVAHRPAARRVALPALLQLDLAVDDDQIGVLMDLVLLELLAGRQKDRDRARCAVIGAQDLR